MASVTRRYLLMRMAQVINGHERQRWVILPPTKTVDSVFDKQGIVRQKPATHRLEVVLSIDAATRVATGDATRLNESGPVTNHMLQLAAVALLVYLREVDSVDLTMRDDLLGITLQAGAADATEKEASNAADQPLVEPVPPAPPV